MLKNKNICVVYNKFLIYFAIYTFHSNRIISGIPGTHIVKMIYNILNYVVICANTSVIDVLAHIEWITTKAFHVSYNKTTISKTSPWLKPLKP